MAVARHLADTSVWATASRSCGVTVLHYGGDYDIIAGVTGQPVEWVVARGTAE